jgi:hypothetical protein
MQGMFALRSLVTGLLATRPHTLKMRRSKQTPVAVVRQSGSVEQR